MSIIALCNALEGGGVRFKNFEIFGCWEKGRGESRSEGEEWRGESG